MNDHAVLKPRILREEQAPPPIARGASGRAPWPFAPLDERALPETMPGGKPWPLISIVTPTRNQAAYIEETLLSVRHQNYPRIEHIVIDGASTDETMDIVQKHGAGLARVVSERDRGQSDAINKGMRLASGDIVTWLNSDDMLAPGALASAALALSLSGADMVAGECHVHDKGVYTSRHLTACDDGPLPLAGLLDLDHAWNAGQFFYQPEVMFTRALWERAGAHVRDDLFFSMDYELWCRFAHAGAKIKVIGRPIALFRAHPQQKTAGEHEGGFKVELPKARAEFLTRTGVSHEPPRHAAARKRLSIVLFNDLGYAYGAGVAHRRLARALSLAGHDVHTVCCATATEWCNPGNLTRRSILDAIEAHRPDLVVMGNIHGASQSPELLSSISSRVPVALVLHDLWWLTGRCPYTNGCTQYLNGCNEGCSCPQGYPALDGTHVAAAWEAKRKGLLGKNVYLWGNSRWAIDRAREAFAARGSRPPPMDVIAFGLEPGTFIPRNRAMCREALGLPQDRFIIMTSATSTDDVRKGLKHLAEALQIAALPDVLVIAAGHDRGTPAIPDMRMMGYVNDQKQLAMMLSAADIFVGPSLEEAFGQVFIEAAACGTPSAGYAVGGKPEAVLNGVTGLLADRVEPAALAGVITRLYSDPGLRQDMGRWATIWAEGEWSMSRSAGRIAGAMRRQGLWQALGLQNRLTLGFECPEAPREELVAPTWPAWRALNGFDGWEGPYHDRGLPRFRWMHGPRASFELSCERGGPGRVLIHARCNLGGQRIRLSKAGRFLGERTVPGEAGRGREVVLSFDATFHAGSNVFEIEAWKWHPGPRPMALLVTSISAIPHEPERASQVEAKPATSAAAR
jgi:glycosyltransferase involved in cell wall biosynthesis